MCPPRAPPDAAARICGGPDCARSCGSAPGCSARIPRPEAAKDAPRCNPWLRRGRQHPACVACRHAARGARLDGASETAGGRVGAGSASVVPCSDGHCADTLLLGGRGSRLAGLRERPRPCVLARPRASRPARVGLVWRAGVYLACVRAHVNVNGERSSSSAAILVLVIGEGERESEPRGGGWCTVAAVAVL